MSNSKNNDILQPLNAAMAAALAGMSPSAFGYYIRQNRGPRPFSELSGKPLYTEPDVLAWKNSLIKYKPGRKPRGARTQLQSA